MSDDKLSKFDLIFFLIFSNYILVAYILTPKYYENLGRDFYQVPLFMGIVGVVFLFFLPKRNRVGLKKILNTKIIRFIFFLYTSIEFLIVINASSRSISYFYNDKYNFLIFFIAIFLVIVILSINGLANVIKVGAVFFLVSLVGLGLPIVANYKAIEVDFIKPINLDLDWSYLYYLIIPINFSRVLILNDMAKDSISKKTVIIGFILFNSFILIDNLLTVFVFGDRYLSGYRFLGYISFRIQNTFRYLGQVDIIYMFLIICISCFKGAYLLSLMRIMIKTKRTKTKFACFLAFVFIISFLYVKNVEFISLYWILILIGFGMITYLFLIFENRRIEYAERNQRKI